MLIVSKLDIEISQHFIWSTVSIIIETPTLYFNIDNGSYSYIVTSNNYQTLCTALPFKNNIYSMKIVTIMANQAIKAYSSSHRGLAA